MNRTHPKHFAKYSCCSLFGYNLYLYAINIYNHFLSFIYSLFQFIPLPIEVGEFLKRVKLNTSDEQKINEFINTYKHRKGLKILIFEMTDEAHIITYEQMQSFIHTLHVFDYIRQIIENESNRLVVVNDSESPDVLQTDSYMHKLLNLNK